MRERKWRFLINSMNQKKYISLSDDLQSRILEDRKNNWVNPYRCADEKVIRRDMNHDKANLWRPAFVRDCEKIMHNPFYNRYNDKTQVFSLYRNDDISRRSHHVQLVSRIARNIGSVLGLNIDLIEAISLGHDIGHTPFGHAGERKLNDLYKCHTGRLFNHNIHSARVFDKIFPINLSLQTLDGIICHNGEMELEKYEPKFYDDFETFDKRVEDCYIRYEANKELVPATLEACVMRVSDIIAYLGKDRQDAIKLGLIDDDSRFNNGDIGKINAEIINNMTVNIIENSYGKPYLKMDPEFFEAFKLGKKENYEYIYNNEKLSKVYDDKIFPMIEEIYDVMLKDVKEHNTQSYIYRHHINYVKNITQYYSHHINYEEIDANDIVVDYIASMTDDYFIDLYNHLFPNNKYNVYYVGYFRG